MKLVLENICKAYGEKIVLKDVSYNITEPGITKIDGKSGSGKTTLFRIIAGLEAADSGNVEASSAIAYMFQEPRLFPEKSLLENATLGRKKNYVRAKELLEKFGLGGDFSTKAKEASGGMQQRTALVRTIVFAEEIGADIFLFDEPFSSQDEENAEVMKAFVRELAAEKIVLVSSHIGL